MQFPSLFVLLLPLLVHARTVDIPDLPGQLSYTPAEALSHAFRAGHDAHFSARKKVVVTTRNELVQGKCADIIVIFARGSLEPGNVGDDVGPYFFDELEKLEPGRCIVQGVNNYPATLWDYLFGGSNSGAKDMAASVKLAKEQCPGSKVVLSGFSQGAQVTHKAAKLLDQSLYGVVGAIVLFGDPNNGTPFPESLNKNLKTFCHEGDLICEEGLPIPTKPHFDYEKDAPEAAKYVADRL